MGAQPLTEKGIQGLLIQRMKEKQQEAVSVLKMIKTRISTERGRQKNVAELLHDDILKIVRKEMKEILETIDSLKKAGLAERIREEENKLKVLEQLLPPTLGEEEIESIVREVLEEVGRGNFGAVMKAVMARVEGRADGKVVSGLVKKALG